MTWRCFPPVQCCRALLVPDCCFQMISVETLELMSKALEMFVQELTLRSLLQAQKQRRKTLFKRDLGLLSPSSSPVPC